MTEYEMELWLERCENCGSVVDVSEIILTKNDTTTCVNCAN